MNVVKRKNISVWSGSMRPWRRFTDGLMWARNEFSSSVRGEEFPD
jgi:hypothetical protein